MPAYSLRCFICEKPNDERETSTYCTSCGGVLTVRYAQPSADIQYPVANSGKDPLRHGPTELRKLERLSERYECEIWGKMELQNPSGCFKDRGSYIEVLKARELGADAICLASTGNMAASVAMYATYFGIPCFVFVPEATSEGKLAQANMFNATVLRIKGDFSACETLCKSFARSGNYYLAGDYVFREEGQKSVSYEILEQHENDFDFVLIPVGCGTNFGAIHKGYKEAIAGGIDRKMPKLVCIQPDEASPVVQGIMKREKVVVDRVKTLAGAVAASNPIDFHKVLYGIDESGGHACTVSDNDILLALREMSESEGIFTEPACALPLAALKKDTERYKGTRVLLMLTGTGLKDTGVVSKNVLPSPVLKNDLNQVLEFIESGYPRIQSASFGKPRDTILAQLRFSPDKQQLFEKYLEKINRKGKSLTPSERDVLQTLVLNEDTTLEYPLEVLDYTITMRKNGLVQSTVCVSTGQGVVEMSNDGVGPLDSVMGALDKIARPILEVNLVNHQLEILSPGTNALVVASITLERGGQEIEAKAASPDVIEAAVSAWLKGFAVLFAKQ